MRHLMWVMLAVFAAESNARADGMERFELGASNGYSAYGAHVGFAALWRHGITPRVDAVWSWGRPGRRRGIRLAASVTRALAGADTSGIHLSGGHSPTYVSSWIGSGSICHIWQRSGWSYWVGGGLSGEVETQQTDPAGGLTTRRLVWPELVVGARYQVELGRSLALVLELDVGTLLFYWRGTASVGLTWAT